MLSVKFNKTWPDIKWNVTSRALYTRSHIVSVLNKQQHLNFSNSAGMCTPTEQVQMLLASCLLCADMSHEDHFKTCSSHPRRVVGNKSTRNCSWLKLSLG